MRLRDLRQLERVAEQDEVARRRAGGEGVGERQLAGLHHEAFQLAVVEVAAGARACWGCDRARDPLVQQLAPSFTVLFVTSPRNHAVNCRLFQRYHQIDAAGLAVVVESIFDQVVDRAR